MLDQKMKDCRCEVGLSSEKLKLMQLNWSLFLKCIVTGDETWIYHYDPESTQQSMQWKHASSPSPRKFKVQASISWQDNVTTFWDAQSVLLTDFMPIRYDTRCYFNVRSKADMNRLNLPHGDCLTCLTKRQLQGFITLTYFTNCVPQLKTSAEES